MADGTFRNGEMYNWSSDPAVQGEKSCVGTPWRRRPEEEQAPSSSKRAHGDDQGRSQQEPPAQDIHPLPPDSRHDPARQAEIILQLLAKAECLEAQLQDSRREADTLAGALAETKKQLRITIEERDHARSGGVEDKGTQTQWCRWEIGEDTDGGDVEDENGDGDAKTAHHPPSPSSSISSSPSWPEGKEDQPRSEHGDTESIGSRAHRAHPPSAHSSSSGSPFPFSNTTPCTLPYPTNSPIPASLMYSLAQSERTVSSLLQAAQDKDKVVTGLQHEIRDLWAVVDELRDVERLSAGLKKMLEETSAKNAELEGTLSKRTSKLSAALEAGRRVVRDLVRGVDEGENEGRVKVVVKVLTANSQGEMWDLPLGFPRRGTEKDASDTPPGAWESGRVRVTTASAQDTAGFAAMFRRVAYRAAVKGARECVLLYGRTAQRTLVLGFVLHAVIEGLFDVRALETSVAVGVSFRKLAVGSSEGADDGDDGATDDGNQKEAGSAEEAERLVWATVEDARRRGGLAHTAHAFHLKRGGRKVEGSRGLVYVVELEFEAGGNGIAALVDWLRVTGQGGQPVAPEDGPELMATLAPVLASESIVTVVATLGRVEDDAEEGDVDVQGDDGTVQFIKRIISES